jgi:hypothetical protein
MVLFVSQILETSISDLWSMNYPEFLRMLVKSDEIAEARLASLEKTKGK